MVSIWLIRSVAVLLGPNAVTIPWIHVLGALSVEEKRKPYPIPDSTNTLSPTAIVGVVVTDYMKPIEWHDFI